MIVRYNTNIQVISISSKGQVFFRRLLKRQQALLSAFGVTSFCPRCL